MCGLLRKPSPVHRIKAGNSEACRQKTTVRVCIHGEPVLPFLVVLELARREQAVLPNLLVILVGPHGCATFGNDPICGLDHFRHVRSQPLLIASEQVMLGSGPKGPAVIQVVTGLRIVVLGIDTNAVKDGSGLAETPGKRLRTL
jgi:hypothetical protein